MEAYRSSLSVVYVIPYYRLTPDICRVLVDNFEGLTVWRFTDGEFKKFKQIAVIQLYPVGVAVIPLSELPQGFPTAAAGV